MKQQRVVVRGAVQGVWFRHWTMEEAGQRALNGWVRNRRDGTVEAVFAGEDDAVDAMVRACRKGPPAARVVAVEQFPHDQAVEAGFRYLPSV